MGSHIPVAEHLLLFYLARCSLADMDILAGESGQSVRVQLTQAILMT